MIPREMRTIVSALSAIVSLTTVTSACHTQTADSMIMAANRYLSCKYQETFIVCLFDFVFQNSKTSVTRMLILSMYGYQLSTINLLHPKVPLYKKTVCIHQSTNTLKYNSNVQTIFYTQNTFIIRISWKWVCGQTKTLWYTNKCGNCRNLRIKIRMKIHAIQMTMWAALW